MTALFAQRALLPDGWAHNVRLEIDASGHFTKVERDAAPGDAERVAGPLIPGMPNLHSHAFQRVMAGLAEVAGDPEDSFWTWRDLMYRLVARITPEQMHVVARHLYIEMLKAGYTRVAEFHYVHHDLDGRPYDDPTELAGRLSQAAVDAGMGLTLLPVLYSHSGFGGQPANPGQRRFIQTADAYLRQHEALAAMTQQVGQTLGLCLHSLRAVTPEQMRTVIAAVDTLCPVHIHIAEQQREVDDCLAWSGRRPIQWLLEHQNVDARWCLVHATHADTKEIEAIARSGAVAGLCPTTEANLGDGIFPASAFLANGGRFGIGSDSHVCVSPAEELRWLEYGQRLRDQRRNRLFTSSQSNVGLTLFEHALSGGAQALGQPIGRLEAGHHADAIVLDGSDPYLECAGDDAILNRWIFGGGDRQVRDVLVAGQWRIRERRHAGEEASSAAFGRVSRALLSEA
ncbi:formimidoylglutamate deiminase [Pseudomonas sp. Marseille-QA0892]